MLRQAAFKNAITRCSGAAAGNGRVIASRRHASSTDTAASKPSSGMANPAATVEAVQNADVLAKEKALEEEARMDITSAVRRGHRASAKALSVLNLGLQIRPEGDAVAAAIVSGTPDSMYRRPVRIYQPSPDTTQSADRESKSWKIDWDTLASGSRWENHLMGWASSADYMQGTNLKFKTRDQAIAFAEKQGYPYFVQEPHQAMYTPKSYSDNFKYSSSKLRYQRTK